MGVALLSLMPRTDSALAGILIQETDSSGLITLGTSSGLPSSTATTASKFAKGCILVDTQTGLQYINVGSVASPSWRNSQGAVSQGATSATIATTGNTDTYVVVAETGTVASIDFSGVDALATSDTNYITWTVVNLGQAGAGSTAVLAATDANTTKATGGTALAANTKRSLTLNATAANLVVTAGDRLRIRAAATGTLANTVTFPNYLVRTAATA